MKSLWKTCAPRLKPPIVLAVFVLALAGCTTAPPEPPLPPEVAQKREQDLAFCRMEANKTIAMSGGQLLANAIFNDCTISRGYTRR
jgi:hypothetical protein